MKYSNFDNATEFLERTAKLREHLYRAQDNAADLAFELQQTRQVAINAIETGDLKAMKAYFLKKRLIN